MGNKNTKTNTWKRINKTIYSHDMNICVQQNKESTRKKSRRETKKIEFSRLQDTRSKQKKSITSLY